jgi:hypothetical protein
MSRSRLPLLGMTALALAGAPTATAFSGFGASAALSSTVTTVAAARNTTAHTCQAGRDRGKTKPGSTLVGTPKKMAVVACEQPPRSNLLAPSLRQSASTGLSAIG